MNTAQIAFALARAGGEVLDEFDSNAPDELFHYTDTAGLIGILAGKGELWATDVRCMNDTDELTLGNSLLKKAIGARDAHPAAALLARLLEHPAYLSGLVFTTSFSSKRDLLSQWRAYADNGAGFAVGFRSAELDKLTLDGKDVTQSSSGLSTGRMPRSNAHSDSLTACWKHSSHSLKMRWTIRTTRC